MSEAKRRGGDPSGSARGAGQRPVGSLRAARAATLVGICVLTSATAARGDRLSIDPAAVYRAPRGA